MTFFDRLESRFGRFAVPNLMRWFTALYGIGFVLSITNPYLYPMYLSLNAERILHGEIWRIVTFLMYPPTTSIFWGLIMLLMYYQLGMLLEQVWGRFRFNLFMFLGVLFHILAAFVIYFVTGSSVLITPDHLNRSIFLAFALTFPEMSFYLYFVIPIKAKYMAVFYLILEAYSFVAGSFAERVMTVLGLLNLFLFLLWSGTLHRFSPKEMKRRSDFKRATTRRPSPVRPEKESGEKGKIVSVGRADAANRGAMHRCAVCGRTELDDPNLEFRYCSKCKGDYEYCMDHLYTHKHVQ